MNPTVQWPDQSLPVEIYYAAGLLTGLEKLAADGLMAMPRIGLGVGGLLLGKREGRRIEILKSVEIPCSHALGPSFALTQEEAAAMRAFARSRIDGDSGHELVGWYCSKPNGRIAVNGNDHELFDVLCRKPWQVELLIGPRLGRITTAAFAIRGNGRNGKALLLGVPHDLIGEELVVESAVAGPLHSEAADRTTEREVAAPESAPFVDERRHAMPHEAGGVAVDHQAPAEVPVRMPATGTLFGAPVRRKRQWPRRLLTAMVLLAILAAAGFYTRGYWPPLALIASADRNGRVSFLWNSEGLVREDHATLVIDDGAGPLRTIHLTQAEMQAGWYPFDCLTGSVTGTLLAGNRWDTITLNVRPETHLPESGISK